MTKYTVLSSTCVLGKQGATVDLTDTSANVRALVRSGHLRPVKTKPAKKAGATKGDT